MLALTACGSTDQDSPDQGAASDALTAATSGAEDTYVTTSYATDPRGTRTNLRVGTTASVTQESYLKFAVTGLPADATNVQATLKVHATTTSTDAIQAHATSAAWSEATLVLAGAPPAQGAVLSSVAGTTSNAWSSFDVSAAVQANGTVAFVLSVPSGASVDFASKEAGAATAPSLTVSYQHATVASTLFGGGFSPHNDARFTELSA
ncbi:MAG: DNRLRE domain-containing protein, partial [Polyangiaceae bacterium]